ncbi:hypothetical protein SprV_0301167100 [Sparganum proliferum]
MTSGYPNDSSMEMSPRVLVDKEVKFDATSTLKTSLKRLQIDQTNWENLAQHRLTWRRTMKTGAAIYEANRIVAVKAKREALKPQLPLHHNVNAQRSQPAHDASGRSGHKLAL